MGTARARFTHKMGVRNECWYRIPDSQLYPAGVGCRRELNVALGSNALSYCSDLPQKILGRCRELEGHDLKPLTDVHYLMDDGLVLAGSMDQHS